MKFMNGSPGHASDLATGDGHWLRRMRQWGCCYASWNHHFQWQRDRSEASRDLAEPLARSGACERNCRFCWGLTSQWSSQDLLFQQKCNHPWGVGSSSGVSMHPLRSELGMARKLPQVLRGFCRLTCEGSWFVKNKFSSLHAILCQKTRVVSIFECRRRASRAQSSRCWFNRQK